MPSTTPARCDDTIAVIILPNNRVEAIETLLDKYAAREWRTDKRIFFVKIDDQQIRNAGHISEKVSEQFKLHELKTSFTHIRCLVLEELNFVAEKSKYWIEKFATTTAPYKKLAQHQLVSLLKDWQLHWMQVATQEVKKWTLDDITSSDIKSWLDQFEKVKLGPNKRWVGEQLLRDFKVWSADQIVHAWDGDACPRIKESQVCFIRYEDGKSGDQISRIVAKKMKHLLTHGEAKELRTFLEENSTDECLVFEDGAFTGKEMSGIIHSLNGTANYDKHQPLTIPTRMKTSIITIHFAIGTDFGLHQIRETIKQLNVAININTTKEIAVLSETGKKKLTNGPLKMIDAKNALMVADDIIPQAFLGTHWGKRRGDAITFCKTVGIALYTSYLRRKGRAWEERYLNDGPLGAANMALLFSFAHSTPKSTLPIFWCHGTIQDKKGNEFHWQPLFPSAQP